MEFWPEFLASSCGKEFVAGGVGGMVGACWRATPSTRSASAAHQPPPPVSPGITAARRPPSAASLLRGILRAEGPSALCRGMGAPLASVAFQNAMVFQVYAILSRSLDPESSISEPPSYTSVAQAGVGTGALQTLILPPLSSSRSGCSWRRRGRSTAARATTTALRTWPGTSSSGRPPRHLPRAYGDRAPRRAGARGVLLDVRVRQGAAAPGLPAQRGREPLDDARLRRPGGRRQLGLLLPAGRGEVPAAGTGVPTEVPRRRGLLPEERPGGGAPRAVARPGHGRRAGLRRQRRHLLGVRAGSAVLGQQQRPEAGHGGE